MIVAATLIGGLLGLGLSLLTTPTYVSSVQFYVTSLGGDSAAAAYQGSLASQQRVQSYARLVGSAEVARQVIDETGADLSPSELASQVEASGENDTVLLNVSVTDTIPERAQEIASGIGVVLPSIVSQLETPDMGGPPQAKLTVVQPPGLPTDPIAPKTEQNLAIGILFGLLLGAGGAVLANVLDRRVKSREQIELIAESSVIGDIPFRAKQDRKEGFEHEIDFQGGHSPTAEAFRRLRTNLQFLQVDKPPKMFVITSSVSEEGKSETAVNLGLALAEAGSRVLLVEADMRRPRVVNYMLLPDAVGLTNVLTGQAGFEDVVQQTRHDGLELLACGPLPPNPSELLASETCSRLLEQLREKYDYVIIDSPPLLPVTDGALLARKTDGAVLVVRASRTTTDQFQQAVTNLRTADARLLGSIMIANRPARKGAAGYYDTYYYSSAKAVAANDG